MADAYRFDPHLADTELPAIQEWLRTHGLDPNITPSNALVVIDEPWITIDQYVPGPAGGPLLDEAHTAALRTVRIVPLIAKPELASLQPVDEPVVVCANDPTPHSPNEHCVQSEAQDGA